MFKIRSGVCIKIRFSLFYRKKENLNTFFNTYFHWATKIALDIKEEI